MPRRDIIVGLDVGTTKICCIIAEVDRDRNVEIVGKGLAPAKGLRKGVVVDIDETVKSIEAAVSEAERMAGFNINSVCVGVTGEHISSINSKGVIAVSGGNREIIENDVKRVIDAARVVGIPSDREVLHVIPRGFTIDGQNGIRNPVGMAGMRLEVDTHIVTGIITFIQNINKCVQKAGLEVEASGIVLEPVAASLAVLNSEEKELGAVLLDIGGGTTDLAMFRNGSIWHTAVIPVGGNHISYDIAVALRIPLTEAERIKIETGNAITDSFEDETIEVLSLSQLDSIQVSTRNVSEIIEARMTEILELAAKEIRKASGNGAYIAGVTLTGGTSLLKGAPKLAEKVLQLPVRVGQPGNIKG
ncbi:MAG: cell division protein FtsA, partial [Firmicutes bacterium]|nr:cell division protein FtsA [Bacillota bacterium]